MAFTARYSLLGSCFLAGILVLSPLGRAQTPGQGEQGAKPGAASDREARRGVNSTLTVNLYDQSGGVIQQSAVVTLTSVEEGKTKQVTTRNGAAEFKDLDQGHYIVHVVADYYEPKKQTFEVAGEFAVTNIQLLSASQAFDQANLLYTGAISYAGYAAGGANIVKERLTQKVMVALRDDKPDKARSNLDQLSRDYPFDANVSFMFGVYEKESKDLAKAKFYWEKAIGLDPAHFASLVELGHIALDEGNLAEAIPYATRAAHSKPTAWQPHAMLVMAYSKQKQYDQVVKEADRALELGHNQAVALQPLLARALVEQGNKQRAIQVLREFLKTYCDEGAQQLLASLQPNEMEGLSSCGPGTSGDFPPLLPAAWMPTGVDDSVPQVEAGVPCPLDTVLQRAGIRATEYIRDVDRFEATEALDDERIGGRGLISRSDTRTYRYMVSIGEVRPGLLSVEEFHGAGIGPADFPDGIQTSGLPALVLVFHPLQAKDYKFTCEGLARTDAGLSWQIYFQQLPDHIPTLHGYTLGDQSYAVALKGRAWIAADSFQVVRLETELTKAHPEIRLAAEHTLINYGPVRFKSKDIQMWLPQKAEVYFDWRGKRIHRRLSYTNYMLYSVEDKQTIKAPKEAEVPPANPPPTKPPR